MALGVREAKTIGDTEIRVRGEAEKLGPTVPRGFLSVLDFPTRRESIPQQSGRLELAYWLTSAHNPLTARVMVNRVWHHLFGQGLVKSVDNFGVTGDTPSHPELLDFLAARFVREGWSIKKLVRSIVLTHGYRLSSDEVPANAAHRSQRAICLATQPAAARRRRNSRHSASRWWSAGAGATRRLTGSGAQSDRAAQQRSRGAANSPRPSP